MQTIRQGVFETNSSSTHSLSISSKDCLYDSVYVPEDGILLVPPMEFGWEEETYNDPMSKLAYVMIYIRDWIRNDSKQEHATEVLKDLVCRHTGATDLVLDDKKNNWDRYEAYIDHQSVEDNDLDHFFEPGGELRLKEFLFNPHSELKTDNDNH